MGIRDFFSSKNEDEDFGESKLSCPKCNKLMIKKTKKDITIDKCLSCNGIWLDKGEIFKILKKLEELKDSNLKKK